MSNLRQRSQSSVVLKYKAVATHLLVGAACFYAGIGVGVRVGFIDCSEICKKQELRIASMRGAEGGSRRMEAKSALLNKQASLARDSSSGESRFPEGTSLFSAGVSWQSIWALCS